MSKEGKALSKLSFGFNSPFTLLLQDGSALNVEQVLRLMPGKRLVVAGNWQNKRVVAKLFFDKRHAQLHLAAELKGIKHLQACNIPTPALLQESHSADNHVSVLLFERLNADINLSLAWRQVSLRDELMPLVKMLIVEIATQHVFGLVQRDLHLDNFLIANNVVYTLDGAQVEMLPEVLPKKQSIEKLALLLSQLGACTKHYQQRLFQLYSKERGWVWKQKDLHDLFAMIDRFSNERWKKYKKKIFRNSTHFVRSTSWGREAVCERRYYQPEFISFMQEPESAFKRSDAIMLKDGRSSTVIRVMMDGRDYVIKRYNIKNALHWLRRCFRETRAKKCWRLAQKLYLFDIKTAQPAAYIESARLGFRSKSYFITEYVAGENIKDYLQHHQLDEIKHHKIIQQVRTLFTGLKNIGLTHGDLKATNILIDHNDEVTLIDLDGAKEHGSLTVLQRATRKEWQRFLRNFDNEPTIKEKFAQAT